MVTPFSPAATPYHVPELSDVYRITAELAADVRDGSRSYGDGGKGPPYTRRRLIGPEQLLMPVVYDFLFVARP
jgi:hypothetical protein